MSHNPANYVNGLLDERAAAVRAGHDQVAADVDAELDRVRPEFEEFDTAGLDPAQRVFVAGVRRRLAAADNGESPEETQDQAHPNLHNAANYVIGLLDERQGAVRAGRTDHVAEIDTQLEVAGPMLERFDPADGGDSKEAAAHVAGARRRLEEHRKSSRGKAGKAETTSEEEPGGRKTPASTSRTAKAAAPPHRTAAE
jgi:hypothetical protein